MRDFYRLVFSLWLALGINNCGSAVRGQSREDKVRNDKLHFEKSGLWYYNDLESGFTTARQTQQPVLVVLRCLPCEECVKLDEELLEANPRFQQLLKSFVRVRIVGTNGLDLSLFQFDTDQSFAVFVFNPDRTLYCRFGTRSDRTAWEGDVSVEGLIHALEESLKIHRDYPGNRAELMGKQPRATPFAAPEKIPSLTDRFTSRLDYEGNVVKSCIHCHMIGDAMREYYRTEAGTLPDDWTFPYPHPKILGLILDPDQGSTIREITSGSPAAAAGFRAGDRIITLEQQRLLSIADVQWVLHQVPNSGGQLSATIQRGDTTMQLAMELPAGWRSNDDIAWRASSWGLRRMGLGGMFLKPATSEERRELGLAEGKMALVVQHVGAFAPHDRAKKAGMLKGDIILEYDGRDDLVRETDLLVYAINRVPPGRSVPLRFRRGQEVREAMIATAP
jgi:serine protease Do